MTNASLERSFIDIEQAPAIDLAPPDWDAILSKAAKTATLVIGHTRDLAKTLTEFAAADMFRKSEIIVGNKNTGYQLAIALNAIVGTSSEARVLIHALHLVEQLLLQDSGDTGNFKYFNDGKSCEIMQSLKSLLTYPDYNIAGRASFLLTYFLQSLPEFPENSETAQILVSFIARTIESFVDEKTKQSNSIELNEIPGGISTYIYSLSVILRDRAARENFTNATDGDFGKFKTLVQCLNLVTSNMPTLYNTMLCVWLLSFSPNVLENGFSAPELNVLVSILKLEPVEKVIRVCLSLLRLVLTAEKSNSKLKISRGENSNHLSEVLISLNTLRVLDNLQNKKSLMKDEELHADLIWVHDILVANYKVLTTFDRHEKELQTERLHWSSTVHSESFWKENVNLFERNNFSSVKKLIGLLGSRDATTAAIACFDLGHFVQYYPNGKLIVETFGGKQKIMMLLQHETPEVQKQALAACSKIMISNWKSMVSAK